jgi:hypothetical protein
MYTYGEIGSWAVRSQRDFCPPPGLPDAKASIDATCSRNTSPNPCNSRDGSNATAPADRAAWSNIVNAAGGADLSGGGSYMCVGTTNCVIVTQCKVCRNFRAVMIPRPQPLAPSGTATVGNNTLYFYRDALDGWGNAADRHSACHCPQQRGRAP